MRASSVMHALRCLRPVALSARAPTAAAAWAASSPDVAVAALLPAFAPAPVPVPAPMFAPHARRTLWTVSPARRSEEEAAAAAAGGDADGASGEGADAEEAGEEESDPRATLEEQTKPDEELAKNHMYFELLVNYWRENDEVPWYRIDELQSADKLVLVVNRFASMQAAATELFDGLEERGRWSDDALASLDGRHLATLAWSYARVGAGSDALFTAISTAAASKTLDGADQRNLDWALAARA